MTADPLVLPPMTAAPAAAAPRGRFRRLGVGTGYNLMRFPIGVAAFVVVTGALGGCGPADRVGRDPRARTHAARHPRLRDGGARAHPRRPRPHRPGPAYRRTEAGSSSSGGRIIFFAVAGLVVAVLLPFAVRGAATLPATVSRPLLTSRAATQAELGRLTEGRNAAVGRLRVVVEDDGVGGALLAAGHGLAGLTDRLTAVDGVLTVDRPRGGPTG